MAASPATWAISRETSLPQRVEQVAEKLNPLLESLSSPRTAEMQIKSFVDEIKGRLLEWGLIQMRCRATWKGSKCERCAGWKLDEMRKRMRS